MPPPLLLSPADIDFTRVVANAEEIRAVNPQRFEMEALTAIVLLDHERKLIAGYKDVGANEFWCRGHTLLLLPQEVQGLRHRICRPGRAPRRAVSQAGAARRAPGDCRPSHARTPHDGGMRGPGLRRRHHGVQRHGARRAAAERVSPPCASLAACRAKSWRLTPGKAPTPRSTGTPCSATIIPLRSKSAAARGP